MALCAGVAGLELGIKFAEPRARTVCYVEHDPYAACVLAARMEEGSLESAPVWDDLRTFDARPWRGVVDCVAAGFPCQPASVAGKRGGTDDARWLWNDVARVIGECEPGVVWLENVPGLLSVDAGRAFHHVVGDLASLGLVGCYDLFRASDVGAPHRRERLFVLAVGNTDEPRLEGWHESECSRGDEQAPWPPGPEDHAGWQRWLEDGGPAPAEPRLRGGPDGPPDWLDRARADRLRCLGNAVVPQQAALALRVLWSRIGR